MPCKQVQAQSKSKPCVTNDTKIQLKLKAYKVQQIKFFWVLNMIINSVNFQILESQKGMRLYIE